MSTLFLDTITDAWTLPLTETDRQQAWQASQSQGNPERRWVTYLNRLTLNAFQQVCPSALNQPCAPWPSLAALPAIWEFTTGMAIALGEHRLVLIPTETVDASEFSVPQEWVDIPDWAADYYVSVQLTPNESELRILGCTSHQWLKTSADYDAFDRTYTCETEDLMAWESFALTYGRYAAAQTRGPVAAIAPLDATQAQNLIQRLGNPQELLPRLEIPFAQWGALLANPVWREQLFAVHRGQSAVDVLAPITQLSLWLQSQFDSLWQPLDSVPRLQAIPTRSRRAPATQIDGEVAGNGAENGAIAPMVHRVKPVTFNESVRLWLVLGVAPLQDGDRRIFLSLEPAEAEQALPGSVQLRLLSDAEEEIGQASAATTEVIEMQFRASPGEQFFVEISSEATRLLEHFEV